MSSFLRTGDSYFVSYRDPNLAKTNAVYEKIPDLATYWIWEASVNPSFFLESTGWIAACAGVPSGSFSRYFCMIGEAFS